MSFFRHVAIALVVLFTGGCLHIPTGEYGYEGLDLRKKSKELHVDKTTQRDVVTLLLRRPADIPEENAWLFVAPTCRGFGLVFAPPPAGPVESRLYYLLMTFDSDHVLRAWELRREPTWAEASYGMTMEFAHWEKPYYWEQALSKTEPVGKAP